MRPPAPEVGDNPVPLRDQLDDLQLKIWKRAPERPNPVLRDLRELARRELIKHIDVPLAHRPFNPRAAALDEVELAFAVDPRRAFGEALDQATADASERRRFAEIDGSAHSRLGSLERPGRVSMRDSPPSAGGPSGLGGIVVGA